MMAALDLISRINANSLLNCQSFLVLPLKILIQWMHQWTWKLQVSTALLAEQTSGSYPEFPEFLVPFRAAIILMFLTSSAELFTWGIIFSKHLILHNIFKINIKKWNSWIILFWEISILFSSEYTNSYSHQWYTTLPFLYIFSNTFYFLFMTIAILINAKWYFVVLIWTSVIVNGVEHLCMCLFQSLCLLCRNLCSAPLQIF